MAKFESKFNMHESVYVVSYDQWSCDYPKKYIVSGPFIIQEIHVSQYHHENNIADPSLEVKYWSLHGYHMERFTFSKKSEADIVCEQLNSSKI